MAGSTVLPPALVAVTGANGFIAAHVVLALLKEGYDVRAIVRDPSNEDKTGFLKEEAESMGASDRLSFAAGDLLVDGSYDPAVEGCDAVVHSAAVVNLEGNGDAEEKVVKPAISGTRNVLNSVAKVDGLKRFIQTSSIAAIYRFDEPEDYVFTENDWNTWSSIENGDAYGYGKSVSEKLVWEEKEKGNLGDCQVVSINPWVVIGPILSKSHVNSSAAVLAPVITYDKLVNFEAGWVDVREVAQAHVYALQIEEAAGKRFILDGDAGALNTEDLLPMVHAAYPEYDVKSLPLRLPKYMSTILEWSPKFVLRNIFGFSEFHRNIMTKKLKVNNGQSKEVLGIEYRPLEETVADTVGSLRQYISS